MSSSVSSKSSSASPRRSARISTPVRQTAAETTSQKSKRRAASFFSPIETASRARKTSVHVSSKAVSQSAARAAATLQEFGNPKKSGKKRNRVLFKSGAHLAKRQRADDDDDNDDDNDDDIDDDDDDDQENSDDGGDGGEEVERSRSDAGNDEVVAEEVQEEESEEDVEEEADVSQGGNDGDGDLHDPDTRHSEDDDSEADAGAQLSIKPKKGRFGKASVAEQLGDAADGSRGRKQGTPNWSDAEKSTLVTLAAAMVPVGGDAWKDVATALQKIHKTRRLYHAVRQKFQRLVKDTFEDKPTGTATLDEFSLEVRRAHKLINDKTNGVNANDAKVGTNDLARLQKANATAVPSRASAKAAEKQQQSSSSSPNPAAASDSKTAKPAKPANSSESTEALDILSEFMPPATNSKTKGGNAKADQLSNAIAAGDNSMVAMMTSQDRTTREERRLREEREHKREEERERIRKEEREERERVRKEEREERERDRRQEEERERRREDERRRERQDERMMQMQMFAALFQSLAGGRSMAPPSWQQTGAPISEQQREQHQNEP